MIRTSSLPLVPRESPSPFSRDLLPSDLRVLPFLCQESPSPVWSSSSAPLLLVEPSGPPGPSPRTSRKSLRVLRVSHFSHFSFISIYFFRGTKQSRRLLASSIISWQWEGPITPGKDNWLSKMTWSQNLPTIRSTYLRSIISNDCFQPSWVAQPRGPTEYPPIQVSEPIISMNRASQSSLGARPSSQAKPSQAMTVK